MRFGKNVLSQYLRTNCELALYLTLFTPTDLEVAGLPTPLDARPGVGSLRDAGVEQETLVYNRLLEAFGDRCVGSPPHGETVRWRDQPVTLQLNQAANLPAVLIQPKFQLGEGRNATLKRLGVATADLALMPRFEGFIPDLALVESPCSGVSILTATGDRIPWNEQDNRSAISLIDVKHAQEANPSYEAEVVLYAVLLANWLADNGLDDRYFVNASPCLWTRRGISRGRLQEALDRGLRDPVELIESVRAELEPVNVPIYVQAIRRFFSELLPDVVRRGQNNWGSLDWHVNPTCASCDWLGYEGWLGPSDRPKVEANPHHYCYYRANQLDHISRLPLVTRGSRRLLEARGLVTIGQLAATTGAEAVYGQHSRLKADRRSIPGYATAIATSTSTSTVDSDRADGMLARYADLDIFVSVNFDPGAGLLTGLGLQAHFRQFYPYGQDPPGRVSRSWSQRWVVTAKSPETEEGVVLAFLQEVARIFEFVSDSDHLRGGPYFASTRSQLIFWDHRQFQELCLALGRHLPSIIYDHADRLVKALAWIFPPEEIQELDSIDERRPAVAFVRDTVRRLIRVPAVHALTLFNVAEFYHYGDDPFRAPDQFYREPLSDSIPRERIYEIWSLSAAGGNGFVRWGRAVNTYSQLIDSFSRAIDSQARALKFVAWRLRRDIGNRLRAEAPRIQLVVPNWTPRVAHDSKLWIAWARFEAAFGKASRHLLFMADPEEVEASHEGIRLTRLICESGGVMEFEVSQDSLNTKLRAPQDFLCLSVDSISGFLALPVWAVLGSAARLPADLAPWDKVPMHRLFTGTLEHLDRAGCRASFRLSAFWGRHAAEMERLRHLVLGQLDSALQENVTIVPATGLNVSVERLEKILRCVGNPPNATPDPRALSALGTVNRRRQLGRDPVTPISRVLWEANMLCSTPVRPLEDVDTVVSLASELSTLNESQQRAVRAAALYELTVIWGPPGTGKTRTCAALLHAVVKHELLNGRSYSLLISGPTYKAVGELVRRLAEALNADPEAICKLYPIYRQSRDDRFPIPDQLEGHLQVIDTFANYGDENFLALVNDLEDGAGIVIVAAVTHQCARIGEQLGRLRADSGQVLWPLFDMVLIDETSQVDMTTAVGPLSLMKEGGQLVVAGDHLQMPPVVHSEPPIGAEHLVGSLQTYLTQRFGIPTVPLLENYRSNEQIVSYTRRLGYPTELSAANPETRISLLCQVENILNEIQDQRLPWCDAWPGVLDPMRPIVALTYPDGVAGQANPFEAECVAAIVWLVRNCSSSSLLGRPEPNNEEPWDDQSFWNEGIGVVTPHRAQRAQVVRALQRIFPATDSDLIEGAVDTVERFQGGERHTIIISFGVGDPDVIRGEEGFLMQLERTNVAISRAMGKCIVLMSEEVASHIPDDRKAAATAHALRGVVDEWCNMRSRGIVELPDGETRVLTLRWREGVLRE